MFTSLDLLILVFIGMSAVSLLAVCLIFLLKNKTARKIILCLLAVQGMLISVLNALMTPFTYPGELALGWGLGALSVAALLLELCGKSEKKSLIARLMVTTSVVLGMVNAFLI